MSLLLKQVLMRV